MKISIQNFQSIENLSFDVKGFTTIVGRTNIGKSAIIRSIKNALQNNRGSYYIRNGEDFCEVSLSDPRFEICWKKGKGGITYIIDGTRYDSVGFSTPPKIIEHGFKTISVGSKEFSPQIADQFSPLFLINETGGTCAEILSDISRVNVLNEAQRMIEKDRKSKQQLLNIRQTDIKNIDDKLDKFEGFESLDSEMSLLKQSDASNKSLLDTVSWMRSRQELLEESKKIIGKLKPIIDINVPDEELSNDLLDLKSLDQLSYSFNNINSFINKLSQIEYWDDSEFRIDALQNGILEYMEMHDLNEVHRTKTQSIQQLEIHDIPDVSVPEIDIEGLSYLSSIYDNAKACKARALDLQKTYEELAKELSDVEAEIEMVRQELNVCPLCERAL